MKVQATQVISVLTALLCVCRAALPEPLTMANFDDTIKKDLHFVEFFSPYCAHCKNLAPTWEATYERFLPESANLKVHMHQVNCVESGDLCDRESIRYYPALRLYSGDGTEGRFKMSYPSKNKRKEEAFIKFMRDQSSVKDVKDMPNKSRHVQTKDLLHVMNGDLERPILVSFWPSTDEQLNAANFDTVLDDDKKLRDSWLRDCPDCLELKASWGKLSNQLSDIDTGFVNCKSNGKICEMLQMPHLSAASGHTKSPELVAFLPSRNGGNQVLYNFDVTDYHQIARWSEKLAENYVVQDVTAKTLSEKMDLKSSMQPHPGSDIRPENRVSFVYYYDAESNVPEDFDILPHLLQPIMDIPFQIALYKSSDPGFDALMDKQEKALRSYIHYDKEKPLEVVSEEMHFLNSITSLPTLLCFKDNSLISTKLNNFEPREIRDADAVVKFIEKNSIPFLQELTPETLGRIFPRKFVKGAHTKQDKVVITVVDKNQFSDYMNQLLQMSVASHEFHHVQQLENFEFIQSKRATKVDNVEALKAAKKEDPKKVIQALRKKIDHKAKKFETVFTYLDVSSDASMSLIESQGWNIDKRHYQPGDTIIVSRFDTLYWDTDTEGNILKADPAKVTATLKDVSYGSSSKTYPKLTGSPFGNALRFMDYVHRHGFMGYILVISSTVIGFSAVKRFLRWRRHRSLSEQRNRGLGILGRPVPKHD